MPRASAEGRSAAAYRAGGKPPASPKNMTKDAAAMWRGIVGCKPIGWFDKGSLPILARYCETMVRAEKVEAELVNMAVIDPMAREVEKRLIGLNASCTTMATKLRLSVQAAVDRHSRMLDERVDATETEEDSLLGGRAVWHGLRAVA